MREVLAWEKYLGLPTYVGQPKQKSFLFLKDKIGRQLSSWMDRLISWVVREVLITAVAQVIPMYAISVFKLPKNLCQAIKSIIKRFWWSNNPNKRKIHWINSNCLYDRKDDGELGFRDLEAHA